MSDERAAAPEGTEPGQRRGTLFVLNRADDESGGTLRAAVNLAEALVDDGQAVTFSVPLSRSASTRTLDSMDPRVNAQRFYARGPLLRFGGSIRHLLWVIRHVNEFDRVHIHSAFYLGAVYTAWLCRLRRVPCYLWPHGSLDTYDLHKHEVPKRIYGRLVVRPMLSCCRAVLCTSTREASELQTFGSGVERKVIPLPVPPLPTGSATGAAWRQSFGVEDTSFLVLFLGRIAEKKGLPRLIEAMAGLSDLDVTLVVAGSGDDPEDLRHARHLVEEFGLTDRVKFVGWLELDDRLGAFSASDVYVLPSDNENFALAVVEALLARVPVVISEQVYIGDDLGPVGGVRVCSRAPQDIARVLRELQGSPTARHALATSGYAYAAEHYAPHVIAGRLAELTSAP